jgi:hypothetical protein
MPALSNYRLFISHSWTYGGRGQGTISDFDSGGCHSRLFDSLASAHAGSAANCEFIEQANLCIQTQKSFADPVPVMIAERQKQITINN